MKLFKKNRKEDSPEERKSAGILEILHTEFIKVQRRLARWLGKQSERLSPQGKKVSLLLFGLLMGGISLVLIINSFKGTSVNASVFPQVMESPILSPGVQSDPVLTPEEYEKLIHFRKMIDSLKQSPQGRMLYNDILHGRTGLLDSIDFLLSIY